MRTGRPKVELLLSDEERSQLQSFARSRSLPAALCNRVHIILSSAEGEPNNAIAERLKLTKATVGKWRTRFGNAARRGRRRPDLAIGRSQQHHPAVAGHAAAIKAALDLPPAEPTELDHTQLEFTLSGTVWIRHRPARLSRFSTSINGHSQSDAALVSTGYGEMSGLACSRTFFSDSSG